MKKNVALILLSILTLTSCGKYTFENSSYDKGGIINYSKDEDMVLDGLDNEDVYKNLEVFEIYEPEFQSTLSTKVYEGKNGWYFYQYVNDTTVMYSKNKQVYQNEDMLSYLFSKDN